MWTLVELRRLLARIIGWFPLTPGGVVLLLGSMIAIRAFGIARSDLLMFILGALGAAIATIFAFPLARPYARQYIDN